MIAFALRRDGWYLRSDIIWEKGHGMSEGVWDRPTRNHEYVFLLAPRQSYYYDAEAIMEPADTGEPMNRRTVWSIPPRPYKGAHFAVFPPELPRRCIQAGTSEKGCCAACGAPWKRDSDGWQPTCKCEVTEPPLPCIVLDPFLGSGTTAAEANNLDRCYVGIEVNPGYIDLAQERIRLPAENFTARLNAVAVEALDDEEPENLHP